MPVHRPEPDAVMLGFHRDGTEPDTQLVIGDGERALLFAVGMLIRRRRLHISDRLIVRAASDEELDIP